MPEPTPGGQKIPLTDRIIGFLDPEGIIWRKQRPNLNEVPFGPGTPIEPKPLGDTQDPRRFEYNPATNLIQRPRGEYTQMPLTPFEQLRRLARFYDVASICIETRINWLCSAQWSITARDKRKQAVYQPLCNQVEKFLRKPDRVTPFTTWLRNIMLDQLEIDAMTIFKQRDRSGRLIGLKAIDGSTIKPLLDERGDVAAFQQILYGYVRGEYGITGVPPIDPWPIGGDLIYAPRWTSTDKAYGQSPTEAMLLRINLAIRKQTFDLSHYTDGNTPEAFMVMPNDTQASMEQVRQFENNFNADLAGVDRARNRIKFIAWDGKYVQTKPFSYSKEIDEFMLELACATYHIPKNELGMTDKLNKATSQEQEDVAFRHAIGPDANWLKTVIFDPIIQEDLDLPGLQFTWDFGKSEDEAKIAGTEQADIAAGVITATESRRRRYPDLDGDAPGPPATPVPSPNTGTTTKLYTGATMHLDKAENTVTTDTGLVASGFEKPRKRKRNRRKPVDVAKLIESESAGALEWAKKVTHGTTRSDTAT